jgi:hypothetical protein
VAGSVFYFLYGFRNSRLAAKGGSS